MRMNRSLIPAMAIAMCIASSSGGMALAQEADDIFSGTRPDKIPSDWIGSPTRSADGFRWDDPNGKNSVRFFRGNANDPDPSKREPFVVVVSDGEVLGRDGNPVPGAIPEE